MAGILATLTSGGACAISLTEGDWKLDISGTVNGFYTFTDCGTNAGASQWNTFSACNVVGGGDKVASIENGFLPAWVNFVATKRSASGFDIKAHIGIAPGISNPSIFNGRRIAGAQSVGDVRNAYLTSATPVGAP